MMVSMSKLLNILSKPAAAAVALALATAPLPSFAASKPVTQNGITTQQAKASEAFPGLQKFLSLPTADRSQVNVYYVLRIKKCDASKVRVTLTSGGQTTTLNVARDGRVTPLPTLAQLNSGATITTSGPETCTVGMKIKVFSPQGQKQDYDAAGLATGIKQGNNAMGKIAGVLAVGLPKLDRAVFVGGRDGVVEFANGQKKPLPKTTQAGEFPAGTPYFIPSQFAGAVKIHMSAVPSAVMFDTP